MFCHKNRLKYHCLFMLCAGFWIIAIPCSVSAEDCFVAGPYVLNVTDHSARIIWVSEADMAPGEVILVPEDDGEEIRVVANISDPRFQDARAPGGELDLLRHMADPEGLSPFMRYRYVVQCGDGESERSGTFKTAPLSGEDVAFDFVVTADGHADTRDYTRVSVPVGALEPSFVIHAGDFSGGYGADWHRWMPYFRLARPYLESSVLVPVVGSHDVRPSRNFRAFFGFNDPDGDPSREDEAGTWYSMDYGSLLVIVLDHDHDLQPQYEFARQVLSESAARWRLVTFHQSEANVGGRGNMFRGIYYDLARLFEQYDVDLVFTGHDHLYERKIPIGPLGKKPVHYICVNSNGNYRDLRPSPIIAGGIGQHEFMYAHVRIDGDYLEMDAIKFDGTVIDRLVLIKDEFGKYQDEIMDQAIELDLALKLAHIYTGQSVAEDLRYERRDIAGLLLTLPEAGEKTTLILNTGYSGDDSNDVSRFPMGSELVVYRQDDPSGWRMERQVIPITGDVAEVELTAPDVLTYDGNGLSPALELTINVNVGGRKFDPALVRPSLGGFELMEPAQLVYPAPMMLVPLQLTFAWQEVEYADAYQVQIASPRFSNIILDTLLQDTELEYPGSLEPGMAHRWRVRGINYMEGPWSEEVLFRSQEAVSAGDTEDLPVTFELFPNYPNPFNPVTTIAYRLAADARVMLRVFDVLGREVAELVNSEQQAGNYSVIFDSSDLPSGSYQYRLEAYPLFGGNHVPFVLTRSMTLMK